MKSDLTAKIYDARKICRKIVVNEGWLSEERKLVTQWGGEVKGRKAEPRWEVCKVGKK